MIEWSKEFECAIQNLKAIELESLLSQHILSKEKKLEMLKELLEKAKKAFLERDLSDMETGKLFDLILRLSSMLESSVVFKEKTFENAFEMDKESFKTRSG